MPPLQGTNLYLIGMPGSGKTTIAGQLAQQLEYQVFDTDTLIEQVTRKSIAQIFSESGEAVFRKWETGILAELASYGRKLVSTGGGIVITPENWSFLRTGVVIWLDVPFETLVDRLETDTQRPLLQTEDWQAKLKTLFETRLPLYQQADLRIEIQAIDRPEAICDRILRQLTEACEAKAAQDESIRRLNETTPFQAN